MGTYVSFVNHSENVDMETKVLLTSSVERTDRTYITCVNVIACSGSMIRISTIINEQKLHRVDSKLGE